MPLDLLCLKLQGKRVSSLNKQSRENQKLLLHPKVPSTRLASVDVPRSTSLAEDPLELAFSCGEGLDKFAVREAIPNLIQVFLIFGLCLTTYNRHAKFFEPPTRLLGYGFREWDLPNYSLYSKFRALFWVPKHPWKNRTLTGTGI